MRIFLTPGGDVDDSAREVYDMILLLLIMDQIQYAKEVL